MVMYHAGEIPCPECGTNAEVFARVRESDSPGEAVRFVCYACNVCANSYRQFKQKAQAAREENSRRRSLEARSASVVVGRRAGGVQ